MSMNMKKLEANQKKQLKKDAKNGRVENNALDDPRALFGRVIKACGNGWFDIIVQHSEKHRETLIEGRAKVRGKSVARVAVNDIIIVSIEGTPIEILGLVTNKNAKGLVKDRRVPAHLLTKTSSDDPDEEGGIEFEEGEQVAENGEPEKEIDVDAI
jgi:hypothetical protein